MRKVRGQMVGELVRSNFLMNRSRGDVLSVLGEPDLQNHGGQTIRYWVEEGRRSILGRYQNDLVIRFGKGSEVFEVSLEAHQDE